MIHLVVVVPPFHQSTTGAVRTGSVPTLARVAMAACPRDHRRVLHLVGSCEADAPPPPRRIAVNDAAAMLATCFA
jgi:hypothetical protein